MVGPAVSGREAGDALATRSLTEWVVLALLVESPSHGFAIAKQLQPGTDLGRVLTVRRPAVYRAIERLRSAELIGVDEVEPGDGGPNRVRHRATDRGRSAIGQWLQSPVGHVRDLRMEFLLKLRLADRMHHDAAGLILAQRATLAPTLDQLTTSEPDDAVELWRRHAAAATAAFLDELARIGQPGTGRSGGRPSDRID